MKFRLENVEALRSLYTLFKIYSQNKLWKGDPRTNEILV